MKCRVAECNDPIHKPVRGRPRKYCLAHTPPRKAFPVTECSGCGGPINRERTGASPPRLCFPCRDSRKKVRGTANTLRWRANNPNLARAQRRRAYAKRMERMGPLPESMCVECDGPTSRGPMALRCRPCLRRHMKLRGKYGLSLREYTELATSQYGRCAICLGEPNGHGDLHVDHDHATGKVRGLLCASCNLGIGNLRDSVDLLARAIEYLRRTGPDPSESHPADSPSSPARAA